MVLGVENLRWATFTSTIRAVLYFIILSLFINGKSLFLEHSEGNSSNHYTINLFSFAKKTYALDAVFKFQLKQLWNNNKNNSCSIFPYLGRYLKKIIPTDQYENVNINKSPNKKKCCTYINFRSYNQKLKFYEVKIKINLTFY